MAHSSKKSGVDGVQVTKRDGRTEDFDSSKITLAIEKCFKNGLGASDDEATTSAAKVTKSVINILNKKTETKLFVEDIQKTIIQQLWARGYDAAAEQYTLFKEKRRQERLESPVSPELRKMADDDSQYFPSALQYYQFVSKFANWNEDLGKIGRAHV